jgi:tripartite-type tricarboxylate transporter receptor subunit TctC
MITRRALAPLLLATPALAQPRWVPERPIRLIVPFPAGGSLDVQARLIAERLGPALGQPVVVENRPGAGGTIGVAEAARAAPDAQTLLLATNGTQAANVALFATLAYDPVRDFAPITLLTNYPQIVAVADWPAEKTFQGLVAALRARREPASFGSSGQGSPTHLAGEMVARALGVTLIHVPYRGQGPALNDLIGGQIQLMFPSVADVLGQLRAGRVTALAALSPQRLPWVPEVPTMAELGHPGLVSSIWGGLYARAGSPPAAIARLNEEVTRILRDPATRQRLEDSGFEVLPGPPEALAARQAEDTARLGGLIRAAGIKAE